MSEVKQAVIFRACPTDEQQAKLRSWMGACRFVWNQFVAYNKAIYGARRRFAFHSELSAFLPEMKRVEGYEWLSDVPAISLVDASRSFDLALRNALADRKVLRSGKKLGRRARGFPVFKKKREGEGRLYLSSQSIAAMQPAMNAPHKARGSFCISKLGCLRVRGGRWPHAVCWAGRIVMWRTGAAISSTRPRTG